MADKSQRPPKKLFSLEGGSMILAVVAIGSVLYGAGSLNGKLESLEKAITRMTDEMAEIRRDVAATRIDVARIAPPKGTAGR